MTRRLPKKFARFAPHLAAAHPVAFRSEDAALETLTEMYDRISNNADTEAYGTGGVEFRRGDGEIEMWVSPNIVWKT